MLPTKYTRNFYTKLLQKPSKLVVIWLYHCKPSLVLLYQYQQLMTYAETVILTKRRKSVCFKMKDELLIKKIQTQEHHVCTWKLNYWGSVYKYWCSGSSCIYHKPTNHGMSRKKGKLCKMKIRNRNRDSLCSCSIMKSW